MLFVKVGKNDNELYYYSVLRFFPFYCYLGKYGIKRLELDIKLYDQVKELYNIISFNLKLL